MICDLDGLSLPKLKPDKVSASIADAIKKRDFRKYVMEVLSAMLTDDSSPFRELLPQCEEILEQAQHALTTEFRESLM